MPTKKNPLSARAWRAARNAVLDLRYGKFLGGTIRSRYEHLGAFHVANTPYDDLPFLFAAAGVGDDDVLVDVGCGKGRVINWLLSHHPANRIVGIELDPDVCRATAKRLRRFANVEIRCGDATTMLPEPGTLFYLFNPFDEHVLRRFADAFLAVDAGGKRRRIVYYNCKYLDVFKSDARFSVEEIELPSRSHGSALISVA
jgi:SAM-dependent methyltransferase